MIGLFGLGRIDQYAKQRTLKLKAELKVHQGINVDAQKDNRQQTLLNMLDDIKKTKQRDMTTDTRMAVIRQKLRTGDELSEDELKYLKDNDQGLYAKAKRAQQMRAEVQEGLRRARTKEEAQRVVLEAQMKVSLEADMEAKYGSVDGAMAAKRSSAEDNLPSASSIVQESKELAEVKAGNESTEQAKPAAEAALNTNTNTNANINTNMDDNPDVTGKDDIKTDGSQVAKGLQKEIADMAKKVEFLEQAAQAKNADTPFDNKFIYMLRAIQNEWAKFQKTKDYDELPIDEWHRGQGKKHSAKKPYRPTALRTLHAVEAYQGAKTSLPSVGAFVDMVQSGLK